MLFTLLSLALCMPSVQEKVLANGTPSIFGTVLDEKGQAAPGATVFAFFWRTAPSQGTVKTYL